MAKVQSLINPREEGRKNKNKAEAEADRSINYNFNGQREGERERKMGEKLRSHKTNLSRLQEVRGSNCNTHVLSLSFSGSLARSANWTSLHEI